MAELRGRLGATEEPAAEPDLVTGSDEDGLVTMLVTADEALVAGVSLDPEWRRVIAAADLAPTVLRAYFSARAAAIARQLEILANTPAPEPPPAAADSPLPPAAPTYVRNLITTVLGQLDAQATRAAHLRTAHVEADSPREAVTVTTTGGQVDTVTIDPEWARRAPVADLTPEIYAAFAAAQARTAELVSEVGGPTTEMTEFTKLLEDPARFLHLLGMRGGEASTS